MNEASTGRTVSKPLDLDAPPRPFTAEEQESLRRTAAMPDEEIDFSDIPRITDFSGFRRVGNWKELLAQRMTEAQARVEAQAETTAETKNIPIAGDVLQFFRERGDASADRINEALREYISTCQKVA